MPDRGSPAKASLREGRYVLLAALGEGAQGTTWDAVDKREGRPVAVKQFDVRGAKAWKDVELAEREARVLAALSHPKLPRYVEHFEEDGILYLVMEKIEGTPLSTLRKQGSLPQAEVVRLLRDADEVLTYLHGRAPPIVHRDLKPSNVIRRPDGSFAFVDFGAVRERLRPEGGSTVVGTFGYMAPEQFQGRAGPGSDVYAMGATALALLTGQEPEKLPHRGLTLDVHAALGDRVNRSLRDALVKMLEPDPDRRATRIGPLLAGLDAGRSVPPPRRTETRSRDRGRDPEWAEVATMGQDLGRKIRDKIEREVRRNVEQAARGDRHAERNAARRAKLAERRARRQANRAARRDGWDPNRAPPWFVIVILSLGLTVAQIAVALALGVIVPTVLYALSLIFGRSLRDAAQNVSAAGVRARAAIRRARGEIRGQRSEPSEGAASEESGSAEGRARVEPGEEDPRVRVSPGAEDEELAAFDEELARDEKQNDRARRSGRD